MKKSVVIIAFAIAFAIVGIVAVNVANEKREKMEILVGEEIPGSGGYCLAGLSGNVNHVAYGADVSPCGAYLIVYYPNPLFLQKDPLPEGTVRGYTLTKGILDLMPEGVGLLLEEGNVDEGRAVITVQKNPILRLK